MKVLRNTSGPGFAELEIGARGVSVVDFGSGAADVRTMVTGQDAITAEHVPMAAIACVATPEHSADEHAVEQLDVRAGAVVPGVGFPLYVSTRNLELTGRWSVAWSWG